MKRKTAQVIWMMSDGTVRNERVHKAVSAKIFRCRGRKYKMGYVRTKDGTTHIFSHLIRITLRN